MLPALALVVLAAVAVGLGAAAITVEGTVVDALGGQPVPGATVRVGWFGTVADPWGRFKVARALPGRWTVAVSAPGFDDRRTEVRLGRDAFPLRILLYHKPMWEETHIAPPGREFVADSGRGLVVSVAPGTRERTLVLKDRGLIEHPLPALTIERIFSVELTGSPAKGRRQATLVFTLPPHVAPASAVILRRTDFGWCLAAPGDGLPELARLGGVLSPDRSRITLDVGSPGTFALARTNLDPGAFPAMLGAAGQSIDNEGNLVVEVLVEQTAGGAWYAVELTEAFNLISITAPDDPTFGDTRWFGMQTTGGFLAPGETKRLVLMFSGTGGSARIRLDLYRGLVMTTADWVCRLATGSALPWPLSSEPGFLQAAGPLLDFVTYLRGAEPDKQLRAVVESGQPMLVGEAMRAVAGGAQSAVTRYSGARGLDSLYRWFEGTLGGEGPGGGPLEPGIWNQAAEAPWLQAVAAADPPVGAAALAWAGCLSAGQPVHARAGAAVSVQPAVAEIRAGQSVRFTARVVTADGARELSAPFLKWEAGGGTVDQDGLFTAYRAAAGTYRVTAFTVGVNPEGEEVRVEGTARVKIIAPVTTTPVPAPPPTPPPASITVTFPPAGASWPEGSARTMRWTSTGWRAT